MTTLEALEARFRELDLAGIERIDAPNGEWSYLRIWDNRDKAVTLQCERDGVIVVELIGAAEDDEDIVEGCVTTTVPDAAVAAFLAFVAKVRGA